MTVRFDRVRGLFVSGIAPEGVTAAGVADALAAPAVNGSFSPSVANVAPDSLDAPLSNLRTFLPQFETAEMVVEGETVTITGETEATADIAQIQSRLEESGAYDAVTLTQAEAQFENGDTRRNALTGAREVYANGFWLPEVDVAPTLAECTDFAQAQLDAKRIQFLSGSATLDATSVEVVNAIAAVMTSCFAGNATLAVEIGGHTDSVGADDANLALSLARAETVRTALINRGLPEVRLTAQGFGETDPIADNNTEEGRSANRRTTLSWSE